MDTITCTGCGTQVDPLAIFPKDRCLSCHSAWFDGQPMPTAAEIVAMWR